MTSTTNAAPATATSYATDESYFAARYKQGGRTVYALQLSPAELTAMVNRPDPDANNPGNRRIRASHANGFADYLLEHKEWIAPGIILRAPSIFSFAQQGDEPAPGVSFGLMSFPRRSKGDLHILDGQHRILGFFLADDKINFGLDKARNERATAKRTEGDKSAAYKQAEAKIRELEEVRDRMHTERVSVEIQVTDDMAHYRQMFFDIADNALGITASVKARFDTRKVINRALPAVLDHKLFAGRVDLEQDRIRRSSPYLITARQVIEILRSVNVGIDGRIGKRVESELTEGGMAQKAFSFLDALVDQVKPLQAVTVGSLLPDDLRATSLAGSPLFLKILAGVWWELVTEKAFATKMASAFLGKLAPHMGAPVHENSIWMEQLDPWMFTDGAYGPNGQRQVSTQLTKKLVEWAIEKPAFLDEEPKPAPKKVEVNEDGDVAIDFSDLHDVKALEVEERNAIEDIAAASKAKVATKTASRSKK